MTSRKQQQAEIIFKFGCLIGPLVDIVKNPSRYNPDSQAKIRARYIVELSSFVQDLLNFTEGEAGHSYTIEYDEFNSARWEFHHHALTNNFHDLNNLAEKLDIFRQNVIDKILSIPTSTDTNIFPSSSPFSVYCFLQDLCRSVKNRVILVDAYLDDTIFYRYLRHLEDKVEVTLVTWPSAKYRPINRWTELIDISRLYAKEHPTTYQLMTDGTIHDRWLCCDDQIYALGGSLKDAGIKSNFTISKLDISTMQTNPIDQLLNTAQEIYGAANPQHP